MKGKLSDGTKKAPKKSTRRKENYFQVAKLIFINFDFARHAIFLVDSLILSVMTLACCATCLEGSSEKMDIHYKETITAAQKNPKSKMEMRQNKIIWDSGGVCSFEALIFP